MDRSTAVTAVLGLDPVVIGQAGEVLEVDLEPGQVHGPVAETHERSVVPESLAALAPIEGGARVEVVDGGDASWEVRHVRLDADDPKADPCPPGGGLPPSKALACASE